MITEQDVQEVEATEEVDVQAEGVAKRLSKEIANPTVFRQANLVLQCYACGHKEILHENVVGGLRFDMYTTDQHELALGCKVCGTRLKLYYEDTTPIVDTIVEDTTAQVEELESATLAEPELNITENNEPILEENQVQE